MRVEDFAWLPVGLPAEAARVRVSDAELAEVLGPAAVGADGPDVAIGAPGQLTGETPTAIVPLLEQPWTGSGVARAAVRLRRHARARRGAGAAARRLERLGYTNVRTIEWEPGHRIDPQPAAATRAERLPLGLVVVASRGVPGPSVLAAAATASGFAAGDLRAMKSGAVVGAGATRVFRVAVGTAAAALARAASVLVELRERAPAFAGLVPEPRAGGSTGLGHWTTETRLQGEVRRLDDSLLRQSVDVLERLHRVNGAGAREGSSVASAAAIAARAPLARDDLLRLGAELDGALAAVPRGFAHGDFWSGNLLSADGRLTGIVDWEAGGPGRLPLLDLMHLLSAPSGPRTAAPEPGRAFEWIWAHLDDEAAISDYCQRIGIDGQPALLRRLAIAFWLERTAWVIDRSVHDADSEWVGRNVEGVLRFVAERGELG